jgi:predicted transcriptional regulator
MNSEFEDAYEDLEYVRGAVLETPVSELMARNPLVVDADATVVAAVNAMNERHTGCVLVEKDGKLVGIFTERDVLRKVIFREGNSSWKVSAVMTRHPETLPPDASVAYALNKMSVGVLSVRDIVDRVVDYFPEDILNLPSDPQLAIPRTMDGG